MYRRTILWAGLIGVGIALLSYSPSGIGQQQPTPADAEHVRFFTGAEAQDALRKAIGRMGE